MTSGRVHGAVLPGRWARWATVLWYLVAFGLSSLGCNRAADDLQKGVDAERWGHLDEAASLYDAVCHNHAGSDECTAAKRHGAKVRVRSAKTAIEHLRFEQARELLEKAVRSGVPEVAQEAAKLLGAEEMTLGLEYEQATRVTARSALSTMERLSESSQQRVSEGAKRWLEENRPGVLFEDASEQCRPKPTEQCAQTAELLLRLHPGSSEAAKVKPWLAAYQKAECDRAAVLEWQGKLIEAAAVYEEAAKKDSSSSVGRQAAARADSARLKAADFSLAGFRFEEALRLLEEVKSRGTSDGQLKAMKILYSKDTEDIHRYLGAQGKSVRDALPEMQALAGARNGAARAAAVWLAQEEPALLSEDMGAKCEPTVQNECAAVCRRLVQKYPGRPETAKARTFLATLLDDALARGSEFEAQDRPLDAAEAYEAGCVASPESPKCRTARISAATARLRAADQAEKQGRFGDAKAILEPVQSGGSAESQTAARALLESEAFKAGLAAELRRKAVEAVNEECRRLDTECPNKLQALIAESSESPEAKKANAALATYRLESARIDGLSAELTALTGQCRAHVENMRALDACYPPPFDKYRQTGTARVGDRVERVALATAYALGARGVPSTGKAAWGLILWGALLAVGVAWARLLLIRRLYWPALAALLGFPLILYLVVLAGRGYRNLEVGARPVGVVLREE